MNTEQTVMNVLAMDDSDDHLWSWLIEQVEQIAIGKPYESELVLHEEPFPAAMAIEFVDDRIHVKMESFGFNISYSWKLFVDKKGVKYLDDFRVEEGTI